MTMNIGEFAALTGISVKALRHYDGQGVLPPAEVDALSGHRRYTPRQVRAGVSVKTLRSAGVPLPAAAAAVATSSERAALEAHRAQVIAERDAEDARHATALRAFASLRHPLVAQEREAAMQHFIGWRVDAGAPDGEGGADPGEGATEMLSRMAAVGVVPAGPHWTSTRPRGHDDSESVLCWPVDELPPGGAVGRCAVSGTLPQRTEAFVRWPFDPADAGVGTAVAPIVALAEALDGAGATASPIEIRHRVVRDERDEPVMELAVTVVAR